jgi:aspartate-semialdehyde dehydrogenase
MVSVAVMGATGAVGQEILKTLDARKFPCDSIKLLASKRSAGKQIPFQGRTLTVEELTESSFGGVDLVLSSAGGSISKQFAPHAVAAGAVVVDNTSAFRMDEGVPLVIPEINADALDTHKGIIANPNCSTIIMLMAVAPIHRAVGIKRIVVSTYQAASGAGRAAMDELIEHTRRSLAGESLPPAEKFAHSLAFNCLPHVDVFLAGGYTREETKMVHESHKILGDDSIGITATTIRVPVLRCHSESINLQTRDPLTVESARKLLDGSPGVTVADDPDSNIYPMATTASGRDDVYVGRIREDSTIENGLNLWVVGDQLLKGAALNAIQIAESLLERNLLNRAKAQTA